MKKISLLVLALTTSLSIYAQDISGSWYGTLKVQGTQLRVVFNLTQKDTVYSATMDSPDQGAFGIPMTSATFEDNLLKLEIPSATIQYKGTLGENQTIVGIFKQGGLEIPLDLSREEIQKEEVKRPQEPIEPYPYYSEEVVFRNTKANVSLAGTLTLPSKEGVYPVVILITGSGPQNRNEEVFGHKPFLVISDYLTRKGIGVLRYDDRGVGESTGDFVKATSADFATDVESAIAYLKTREEVDKTKIGLIGHSEGGLIGPMVANRSSDVAFIVLLAGPGVPGDQVLLSQQRLIGNSMGISEEKLLEAHNTNREIFELVKQSKNLEQLKADLTSFIKDQLDKTPSEEIPDGMNTEQYIALQVDQFATPWMRYFIMYDPARELEKVKCPVLALNGEKDLQVAAKENLEGIKNALEKSGNKNVSIKELASLNHLFQESETGLPSEYGAIEETFSLVALKEISNWILEQLK